ncbi:MAG: lipopolysaccharide kinase InaA family protein [Gammaproteobacteria bacterium]
MSLIKRMNLSTTSIEKYGYHLYTFDENINDDLIERCCQSHRGFQPVNCSRAAEVFYFESHGKGYFYKSYLKRSLFEGVKNWFRRNNRAVRATLGNQILNQHGFLSPKTILIGHGFKNNIDFTVTEKIENALPFSEYFIQHAETRRDYMHAFAKTLYAFHAKGLYHGDLRWDNIFVKCVGKGEYHFIFIDNERTKYFSKLPMKKRIRNLVQLNKAPLEILSIKWRLYFFKHYYHDNLVSNRKTFMNHIQSETIARTRTKPRTHHEI